jgi:hypothetical protein
METTLRARVLAARQALRDLQTEITEAIEKIRDDNLTLEAMRAEELITAEEWELAALENNRRIDALLTDEDALRAPWR